MTSLIRTDKVKVKVTPPPPHLRVVLPPSILLTGLIRSNLDRRKERRRLQYAESKKRRYVARERVLSYTTNAATIRQRQYRTARAIEKERIERKKERQRKYTRKSRQRHVSTPQHARPYSFPNRMAKSRSMKKVRNALPSTPTTRAAVLSAYVDPGRMTRSTAVDSFHRNKSNNNSNKQIESETLENVRSFLDKVKRRRSDEARTTLKVLKSSVNGDNVGRHGVATNLAKRLGIKRAAIKAGKKMRTQIMHTRASAFEYVKRKTRSDAITRDVKTTVFNFWLQSENSRPSNNKNDVKRVRLGPRIFSSHTCYILEKTQTEIYEQFKKEYPDINIGQRAFERCKPYFVPGASVKDKATCCCRQHVEARAIFKTCSLYQRRILSEHRVENIRVFESLADLSNATLCPQSANTHQHKLSCLNRQCTECGICKVLLLPDDFNDQGDIVHWERYEYQNLKIKENTTVRKL